MDALFSHEENWMISIENSKHWSQNHNHRPKFHLPWWHFLKSCNLKRHDRATPMKLTKAVAFVRPSKHVEQISHSLASCSNLLLKGFERKQMFRSSEIFLIVSRLFDRIISLTLSTFCWVFDVEGRPDLSSCSTDSQKWRNRSNHL